MPVVKLCLSCNKSLAGYRKHAQTCGSTCRGIKFRANKEVVVPLKIAFSVKHFEAVKTAAESAGVSIAQYAHDQLVQTMEASPW
ncbi:hypothetical protein [Pseudomonas sp. R9.37]|uniref:hypothetical protein n=1 Tax=Pseudomonas sp. R9.37 TaxID=1390498 RepID=UPI0011B2629E|nr:hypothetical protein [Pseudomonas sp. R9.37]